jgi:hypothetical protein
MELTGGCACQSIRYECTEEPIVQVICHCRACQRASGSAFAAIMMVAADKFQFLKGEPAYHEVVGGTTGRRFRRGFCTKCGSPLTLHWPEISNVQMIQVGSLDDPSYFQPETELWLSSGYPWHSANPGTVKFEGRPIAGVRDRLEAYFAARGSTFGFKPPASASTP